MSNVRVVNNRWDGHNVVYFFGVERNGLRPYLKRSSAERRDYEYLYRLMGRIKRRNLREDYLLLLYAAREKRGQLTIKQKVIIASVLLAERKR